MGKIGPVFNLPIKRLSTSSGIVLINAHKKPPHLGLFSNGKYYSLTANEVQNGLAIDVMLQLIRRKKIPSIFVFFNDNIPNNFVEEVFGSYTSLSNGITCIDPIKKVISAKIDNSANVNFVFELIPALENINYIESYAEMYCTDFLEDDFFKLRNYSMQDVIQRIQKLVK